MKQEFKSKIKRLIGYISLGIVAYSGICITNYLSSLITVNQKYYRLEDYPVSLHTNKIEFSFPYLKPDIFHELKVMVDDSSQLIFKKYVDNELGEDDKAILENLVGKYPDEIITKVNGKFRGVFLRSDPAYKEDFENIDKNISKMWNAWIFKINLQESLKK